MEGQGPHGEGCGGQRERGRGGATSQGARNEEDGGARLKRAHQSW